MAGGQLDTGDKRMNPPNFVPFDLNHALRKAYQYQLAAIRSNLDSQADHWSMQVVKIKSMIESRR